MENVSAVITTYKREAEIVLRAVKSILNQTAEVKEIIVVDDNKDNSPYSKALETALKDAPKVKYVKQDGNKGACAARNLGIKNAKGDYVAFLDDDDEWCPDKIEKQLAGFDEGVGMVYCGGTIIDENQDPPATRPYNRNVKSEPTFKELLYMDCIGSTSNPLILKSCIIDCGCFDEQMPARQDYDMWLRIAKKYKIVGIDKPLFLHYLHKGEQISSSSKKTLTAYKLLYKKYKADYAENKDALRMLYIFISMSAKGTDRFDRLLYAALARLPFVIMV